MVLRAVLWLGLAAALAACAATPPDAHAPPFATQPYAAFTRQDAVAIALREWRLFGQPVDDDMPGTRPAAPPEQKPEREAGLWQRVGEYWWLGMDAGNVTSRWTGMHNAEGRVFPAAINGRYAWSAAFISYVMRIAGARDGFVYSPNHAAYINAARRGQGLLRAQRPEAYAAQPGDLVCEGRNAARDMTFDDLPTAESFQSHCGIVVDTTQPGQISIIGGNVDDAVTLTHVPVTPDGKLATADGTVLDARYHWFVVLQVLYAG